MIRFRGRAYIVSTSHKIPWEIIIRERQCRLELPLYVITYQNKKIGVEFRGAIGHRRVVIPPTLVRGTRALGTPYYKHLTCHKSGFLRLRTTRRENNKQKSEQMNTEKPTSTRVIDFGLKQFLIFVLKTPF